MTEFIELATICNCQKFGYCFILHRLDETNTIVSKLLAFVEYQNESDEQNVNMPDRTKMPLTENDTRIIGNYLCWPSNV